MRFPIYQAFALAVIAAAGGALGYMATDREIPVVIIEKVLADDTLSPGETGRAYYKFYRVRSCETDVARQLIDGQRQRFVIPSLHFDAGFLRTGADAAYVTFPVSPLAKPGPEPAVYRTVNCYVCNPLHNIWPLCDAPRDISFTIVP